MSGRIEAILAMLEKEPDDPFLHYSLAMEYAAGGRPDAAAAAFRRCRELDEDYLPTYVEAGKALRAAGKLDDARRTFAEARDLAARLGETHVGDFVKAQLEALGPGT